MIAVTLFKIKIAVVTLSKYRALIFWISGYSFLKNLGLFFVTFLGLSDTFSKSEATFSPRFFQLFDQAPQIILAGTFQKIVVTTFKILLLLFRQPLFFIFRRCTFSTFRSPTYKNQDQRTQNWAPGFFRSRFGFLIFCV